jgi:cullin-associated NEDD8-dissociated protein 1
MAIQAIRYTLPDDNDKFDSVLKTTLVDLLSVMMRDTELENRRLALTTLNSAAHNKPDLIIPNLGQLLPLVMKESVIKPELIREVMMGPFKHKVDDGLEVRKVNPLYMTLAKILTKI